MNKSSKKKCDMPKKTVDVEIMLSSGVFSREINGKTKNIILTWIYLTRRLSNSSTWEKVDPVCNSHVAYLT